MEFTKARHIARSTRILRGFLGYHPALRISHGEWFTEENLSSHAFPLLCPRSSRRRILDMPIEGLGALGELCYITGSVLHYGGYTMDLPLSPGEKELIPFGAMLIIAPDMIWVNTVDHSYGSCSVAEQFAGDMGMVWCDSYAEPLEPVVEGTEPPENVEQFWLDTSAEPALKAWSEETKLWYELTDTRIKVIADGIGIPFATGNQVLITGDEEIERILGPGLHEILYADRDFLVLDGRLNAIRKELRGKQWEIRCPVPKMDFLLQHENRLWGCRYGTDHNGAFVNEIYSSALGDPGSWYSFRGIATDSYVASLGTEGPFTGAAVVGGYPVFFKENSLCRISGNRPSNFHIQSTPCVGVAPGSERTTAILDNSLVYLGRDGFYLYDGSLPFKISGDLDSKHYSQGVGGVLGGLYYIDLLEDGVPVTLCYDREHRLWHRHSPMGARRMVTVGNTLYYTGGDGLYAMGGTEGQPYEEPVPFEAVTGILREDEADHGYLAGLKLRLSMDIGSSLTVYAQYDSQDGWEPLGTMENGRLNCREVHLRLKRCDHLRLKFEGRGNVTVHAIMMIMEG